MARFVKGDWVEVCPHPDYRWDSWTEENSNMCGKKGRITDIKKAEWVDETYIEVEYRGVRVWFKDDHLIKVDNYEVIFSEAVHEACEQLQRHEAICKRLRDEILRGVFGEDVEPEPEKPAPEPMDSLFGDWEEVTTKEIIPLPGNGGTMTTPSETEDDDSPKATADNRRKKIRKIKSLGNKKKIIKKKSSTKKLTDSWTLTDDEIKELEDYLDTLPYSTPPNQAGDYDYDYDYGDDDDSGWFT